MYIYLCVCVCVCVWNCTETYNTQACKIHTNAQENLRISLFNAACTRI